MEDDIRLIKAFQGGCQRSFGLFYDRTAPFVLGVIMQVMPERQLAEQVLEEAFWQAWQQSQTFDERVAPPRLWVCALARRLALAAASE